MGEGWLRRGTVLFLGLLAIPALACGYIIAPGIVTLSEVEGTGVTGGATLQIPREGGRTEVFVWVDGGLEQGPHQTSIHRGTCAEVGPLLAELTPLDADPFDGSAMQSTTVELDISSPGDLIGNSVLLVAAPGGAFVACGPVTEHLGVRFLFGVARLSDVEGSGVAGTATIEVQSEAGTTRIFVSVHGGLEQGSHENSLHVGTCAAVGRLLAELTPLEAAPGAGGTAAQTTTVDLDISPEDLYGGSVLVVRGLDEAFVACGPVEVREVEEPE